MTIPVLLIHGGGEGAYEAARELAGDLQERLGAAYAVDCPAMPEPDFPRYADWARRIERHPALEKAEGLLVGHSLGASFWLYYFAERANARRTAAALYLIAPPYWGAEDWEVEAYALPADVSPLAARTIYLYHSRDDAIVPFAHAMRYAQRLPHAVIRALSGRGHLLAGDMSEVAADMQRHRAAGSPVAGG